MSDKIFVDTNVLVKNRDSFGSLPNRPEEVAVTLIFSDDNEKPRKNKL